MVVDSRSGYQQAKASTAQTAMKWGGYAKDTYSGVTGGINAYNSYSGATAAAQAAEAAQAGQAAYSAAIEAGATAQEATAASEAAASGATSSNIPYLGIALGAYGAYKGITGKGMTDEQRALAAKDAARSTVGNVFSFGLSGLGEKYLPKQKAQLNKFDEKYGVDNFILSHTLGDHGFDESRRARNAVRSNWQKGGLIDDKYQVDLADGSKFDIGQDGKTKYKNVDGSERPTYNTDFSNPYSGQAIAWINPIAQLMTGGNRKLSSDMVSQLTNAFTSNAKSLDDVKANVNAFYNKSGIDPETLKAKLAELNKGNNQNVKDDELQAYYGGIDQLMNPNFHGVEIHNHLDKDGNPVPDEAPPMVPQSAGFNPAAFKMPPVFMQGPQMLQQPAQPKPLQLMPNNYDASKWNNIGGINLK